MTNEYSIVIYSHFQLHSPVNVFRMHVHVKSVKHTGLVNFGHWSTPCIILCYVKLHALRFLSHIIYKCVLLSMRLFKETTCKRQTCFS